MHQTRLMKKLSLLLFCCGCVLCLTGAAHGGSKKPVPPPRIRVVVDPRVELMSIVFRLAGNPEYNQAAIVSYAADVDSFFGRFKKHPAIEMARTLREKQGIGYNAPMALAVCMKDVSSLAERVPLDPRPAEMDPRWSPGAARAFLAELRGFTRDTGFKNFVASHAALYQAAAGRLEDVLEKQNVVGWFDRFFEMPGSGASGGSRPPTDPRSRHNRADFIAAVGFLSGGHSYGASIRLPNGSEEIYSILGVWDVDDKGIPTFDESIVPAVVHEFCHTYTNSLVDRHEAELEAAGKKIFPLVEKAMRDQAYRDWRAMMYESLVRAIGVRFTITHWGADAASREIAYNEGRRFIWTAELAMLLGEYEGNRAVYPTLDAFFPRIATFFTDYSERAGSELAKHDEQKRKGMEDIAARSPRIVAAVPPNGANDVDPALSMITITFDRPMMTGNMGLMGLVSAVVPTITGDVGYDSTRTVLRIPVRLEPGVVYGFSMNAAGQLIMCDEKGNPLVPTEYSFKTK